MEVGHGVCYALDSRRNVRQHGQVQDWDAQVLGEFQGIESVVERKSEFVSYIRRVSLSLRLKATLEGHS